MRFEDVLSRSERSELSQSRRRSYLGSVNARSVGGVIAIARAGLRVCTIGVWHRLRIPLILISHSGRSRSPLPVI